MKEVRVKFSFNDKNDTASPMLPRVCLLKSLSSLSNIIYLEYGN